MFTDKNIVYAESGYYLKHKKSQSVALQSKGNTEDFEEIKMNIKDMQYDDVLNAVVWNNRSFIHFLNNNTNTKEIWIKKRYNTNDEQIAIMLNKELTEHDEMLYNKMQEWREFASIIAKRIEQFKPNINLIRSTHHGK